MVQKSRIRFTYVDTAFNGVSRGKRVSQHLAEAMEDSSATGSARTDVSSVDRFLADPTNHGDFRKALQQDNRSVGDVGLSHFYVSRYRKRIEPASGHVNWILSKPLITNFMLRDPVDSEFPDLEPFSAPNNAELRSKGQALYFRALPNRDQSDLGTLLMEIASNPIRAAVIPGQSALRALSRQGRGERVTRNLRSSALNRHRQIRGLPLEEARAAADDYLAYVFGARPTVNSLDSLAESINRSRQVAELVVRKSKSADGYKRIRRRRNFPTQSRVASVSYPHVKNLGYGSDVALYGPRHVFNEATQSVWFSGSYRMPVPDTERFLDRTNAFLHEIDRITGLGLDVRVAWDLIPFSFMADWFANTGDFLENRQLVADYNIVCEYGYVMCHTRSQQTIVASGEFGPYTGTNLGGSSASASWVRLTETKQRSSADHFGFETNYDSLNGAQWASLAALGLSWAAGMVPTKRS